MSMTDDQRRATAQIAQEVIRAQRATRVPVRKPGTVTASAVPGDPVTVLVAGDTVAITATNASGQALNVGARVVVTFEPPHGVFVTELFRAGAMIQWNPVVHDEVGSTEPGSYVSTGYYTVVGSLVFWKLYVTITTLSPASADPLRFTWPLPAASTTPTHAGSGEQNVTTDIFVYVESATVAVISGASMGNSTTWNMSGFYELAS